MKILLFTIFFCIVSIGCKKNPFDYRSKFTGDYDFFIQSNSYWGIFPNVTYTDTSYSFDGKIEIGTDNNTVHIFFSHTIKPNIYEDGTIDGYGCKGEFASTNKIHFRCNYNSPGGGTTYSVTGEKK